MFGIIKIVVCEIVIKIGTKNIFVENFKIRTESEMLISNTR